MNHINLHRRSSKCKCPLKMDIIIFWACWGSKKYLLFQYPLSCNTFTNVLCSVGFNINSDAINIVVPTEAGNTVAYVRKKKYKSQRPSVREVRAEIKTVLNWEMKRENEVIVGGEVKKEIIEQLKYLCGWSEGLETEWLIYTCPHLDFVSTSVTFL